MLIGATLVTPRAGEILGELVLAIKLGTPLNDARRRHPSIPGLQPGAGAKPGRRSRAKAARSEHMRATPHEHDSHRSRATVDLKLEVVVIPVSDVDRAKRFYESLGWRLDADFPGPDNWRVVQFTPPGSPCSIHFGKGVTTAAPGSIKNLYLVVSDIEAARAELDRPRRRRSARRSTSPASAGRAGAGPRSRAADPTPRSPRSAIPTATAGCSRRSRRVFPDEDSATWTSRR